MGVSGAGVRALRFSAARRSHSASWPGSIRVLGGEEGIPSMVRQPSAIYQPTAKPLSTEASAGEQGWLGAGGLGTPPDAGEPL